MNSLIDPARRMGQVVAICALLSCITTYVLTTHDCKMLDKPSYNASVHGLPIVRGRGVEKNVPGFLIIFLLIAYVPLVVWECIRNRRFHNEQRVSDNRKRMLISSILVIVSVVTMIGIGAVSTPEPFRHMAECFSWGSDVAKSVCYDTSLPAMLIKRKEGYLIDQEEEVDALMLEVIMVLFPVMGYERCTYIANQRNNMILLALYWCHYLSMMYHSSEILYYLVGALLGAIRQWLCVDKNVRGDVELQ